MATCTFCKKTFSMDNIVTANLKRRLGSKYIYAKNKTNRLDAFVYEEMKDFDFLSKSKNDRFRRAFAVNALTNVHLCTHPKRCFKKSSECYANLPSLPFETSKIIYNEQPNVYSNYLGEKENRYMFKIVPHRNIEDVFMNTYNPHISDLVGCNSNVMAAITGLLVFYVTGYATKNTQEEESKMYQTMSEVLYKAIERQVENDSLTDFQKGLRFMLLSIYVHTGTLIIAAPMAYFLAITGSRYMYSHEHNFLPVDGLENYLLEKEMKMTIRTSFNNRTAFHRAMDIIYRPKEFENKCSYKYIASTMNITKTLSKTKGIEKFDYMNQHPFRNTVFRCEAETDIIPI